MRDKVAAFSKDLEKKIKEEFEDEATPEFINLVRIGKAAYEHGYNDFSTIEKLWEWVQLMYESGQSQKRIRQGEEHGRIFINDGDVLNMASYLFLYGKREGYLKT